jgi:hypothetical protein
MPTLNWLTREADLQAAAKTLKRIDNACVFVTDWTYQR